MSTVTPDSPPTGRSGIVLLAVISSAAVVAITMGMTYPLLSLVLEARGFSADQIGLNAAFSGLGLIVGALLLPPLARRYSPWALVMASIALTVASIAAFPLLDGLWIWHVLRFLLGISINAIFVIGEAWLNEVAADRRRGLIIGVYATLLSAGFALGPLLIPLTGIESGLPFLVAIVIVLVAAAPMMLLRHERPRIGDPARPALRGMLVLVPILFLTVGLFGLFDGAVLGLWTVFGQARGLSENLAAYTLAALIAGNAVMQIPIGWLADRWRGHEMLLVCSAGVTLIGAVVMVADLSAWWIWPVLVLWGGFGFGTYTVVLAQLGRRFEGPELVAGTARFALMWGVGALIGPAVAGAAMEWTGAAGLPGTIAVTYLILTVLIVIRRS